MASRRQPRNFGAYGTMEALNVVLVPAMAFFLGRPHGPVEWLALVAAALATSGFLLVGAVYWFAVNRRLRGDRSLFRQWLRIADRAERSLVALLAVATGTVLVGLFVRGWSGAIIAAAVLAVLAGLEYINYYHRQLQHFDNWRDFRRLLSLRGVKRAHSARELSAYRASVR